MFKLILSAILAVAPFGVPSDSFYTEQWGIDRIDQHEGMPDGSAWDGTGLGQGITVYVVDSGISDLPIFGGRILPGYSALAGGTGGCGNYHGTSIASLIGTEQYGISWSVSMVSVRVIGCDGKGTAANIVKGLKWIYKYGDPETSVVNMSLGGAANRTVDSWVNKLAEVGFPVVVAAGNNSKNACNYSPSRAEYAITVGASDKLDMRWFGSNHGPCLSIWAPGDHIPAFDPRGGTFYPSGTSGSAAYVSGAIAAIASTAAVTTEDAANILLSGATADALCCSVRWGTQDLLYLGPDLFAPQEETPWHEEWWAW